MPTQARHAPDTRALLLTIDETAEQLKVCRKTIYNLFSAGELRRVRIGRAVRVPADDVRALIERSAA